MNNPGDALTHHYTREETKKHFKHMGVEFMPTSSEAVRGEVCVNLGESRNLTEKVATCASLLGSPPMRRMVVQRPTRAYGKTSFLPVLRSMPKIISQDFFRQARCLLFVHSSVVARSFTSCMHRI